MFWYNFFMFNIRLKELRESKKLSQKQLAKLIGYTQSHIAKWENDTHEPKESAIIKLATVFEVTTDYLLGLED